MKQRFYQLQSYLNRPWYPLLLGILSAADLIVVFIPIDGLAIAATLTNPRHWIRYALATAFGNLVGSGILAAAILQNAEWLHQSVGAWMHSDTWKMVESFIQIHGSWSVALGALSPIPLQLWVIIPVLAKMSLTALFLSLLTGRLIRSVTLCWIASHAPKLLWKSSRIKKEFEATFKN